MGVGGIEPGVARRAEEDDVVRVAALVRLGQQAAEAGGHDAPVMHYVMHDVMHYVMHYGMHCVMHYVMHYAMH